MRFWLGGYTADMGRRGGTGIGTLVAGAADDGSAGGSLSFAGDAVTATSPSWLAHHPTLDVVYAALESAGTVRPSAARATRPSCRSVRPSRPARPSATSPSPPTARSLIAQLLGRRRASCGSHSDAAGRPVDPQIAPAAADPYAGPTDHSSGRMPHSAYSPGITAGDATWPPRRAPSARRRARSSRTSSPTTTTLDTATPSVARDGRRSRRPGCRARTPRSSCPTAASRRPTWASTSCASGAPPRTGSASTTRSYCQRVPARGTWSLHPSGHLHVVTEFSCEVFTLVTRPGRALADRRRHGRVGAAPSQTRRLPS